jgi:type VI secretion system protein ImpB
MGKESTQHKLDRVRRPRVQITYDVETNGAMVKTELPFVVGVLADLSGQPKDKLPALKQRKVVSIDRDNFDSV